MYNAQWLQKRQVEDFPSESPAEQSFNSSMLLQQSQEQSYLIHSRSSRKRLFPNGHPDDLSSQHSQSEMDESCDIEEFKEEIDMKWQLSTANKFYSFPYTPELMDYDSDSSLDSLMDLGEYCLISQNTKTIDSRLGADKFKIKDKKKQDQQSATAKRDAVMNRLTSLMEGFRTHKE